MEKLVRGELRYTGDVLSGGTTVFVGRPPLAVNGAMTVDNLVHYYPWHGRHHVAHIVSLRQRDGWD